MPGAGAEGGDRLGGGPGPLRPAGLRRAGAQGLDRGREDRARGRAQEPLGLEAAGLRQRRRWVAKAMRLFAWAMPGELKVFEMDELDEAELGWCLRTPEPPSRPSPLGMDGNPHRVVVIGGGFGGLQAVQKLARAGRGDADRPAQLPPLPAADLPGGDRGALARGGRLSAAGDLQAAPQRAGAARGGAGIRPRAPDRAGRRAAAKPAPAHDPIRHADRRRRLRATPTSATTSGRPSRTR